MAGVGTTRLTPLEWVLGGLAGVSAFTVTLWLSGEVTRQELGAAGRRAVMALRRSRATRVGV